MNHRCLWKMLRSVCPLCNRILSTLKSFRRYSKEVSSANEIPIITFPAARQREFVRQRGKRKKGKLIVVPRPGKLLISSDDRTKNLYSNEFPTKFEPPTLACQSWTSHKSVGRYFTIHPTRENPSYLGESDHVSFEELELSQVVINALKSYSVVSPTKIQAKAIPLIFEGENIMISAETGSGKTFAYLLPILHKLLQLKSEGELKSNLPSALVLNPSKELCQQVKEMANSLGLPLKVGNLEQMKNSKENIVNFDLLVGTPTHCLTALKNRILSLENIQTIVVDECDTLLDESFSDYVCNVLGRLNIRKGISQPLNSNTRTQLILCSATFPDYAESALKDVISIGDISSVSTGYMHRVSSHVTQKFFRVRPSEKLATVVSLLKDSSVPTLVFCNKTGTVEWLGRELQEMGVGVEKFHSRLNLKQRRASLRYLLDGKCNIFVTTDLSSRGLDTQMIRHVINYDFPTQASDYIHRSGRVGRVGQTATGLVTSIISKKWEVPLLMKIEEAARRRERILGVNANIKSYHTKRWEKLLESCSEDIIDE